MTTCPPTFLRFNVNLGRKENGVSWKCWLHCKNDVPAGRLETVARPTLVEGLWIDQVQKELDPGSQADVSERSIPALVH
jgi:hypothetical protein